jgi:hypothetical protein
MRLLIEVAAATPTPAGGGGGGGLDWTKLIGIPAAVVAILTLVTTYAFAVIHPLAVKQSRYWHTGATTQFSCVVKNRSFFRDTTVTSVSLVIAPGWLKRTFWPWWKRKPQKADLVPWDLPKPLPTLSKRNETVLEGALRKNAQEGTYDPTPGLLLLAYAGSRASRGKRLEIFTG